MRKMIHIKQQTSVFCDSFVASDTGILFASFWGRNTSLQQFLARMELPNYEGGIDELTFEVSPNDSQMFRLQDAKNMQKLSGRVPGTIYSKDLSHIFVYDKSAIGIDYSNSKATVLYFDDKQLDNKVIWQLIKTISPIPLLDSWMEQIVSFCFENCYISDISGFGGVSALVAKLAVDEFEKLVTTMIKDQHLLPA